MFLWKKGTMDAQSRKQKNIFKWVNKKKKKKFFKKRVNVTNWKIQFIKHISKSLYVKTTQVHFFCPLIFAKYVFFCLQ